MLVEGYLFNGWTFTKFVSNSSFHLTKIIIIKCLYYTYVAKFIEHVDMCLTRRAKSRFI